MLKIPVEINPLGTLNLLELLSIKGCSKYAKIKAIIDDYTLEIYNNIELTEIENDNLFIFWEESK